MKTLLAIVALVSGMSAYAQEASTEAATTKAKAPELSTKQAVEGDIDSEITNAKMRAESGSKSKHSASMAMNYSGGSVDDAFGYKRPALSAGAATPKLTSLAGDVNYRYRISAAQSLTAGVGLTWITPGHDFKKSEQDAGLAKQEASNPMVAWSSAYKVSGVQNITSATLTKYTNKELVEGEKLNNSLNIGQTALMELGTSGWQLGLALDGTYYNYNQYSPGEDSEGNQAASFQTEYELGAYPFAEYVFNDTYNFRTVYRGNTYGSGRDNRMAFTQYEPTQSAGLGIAATRDIFLYPNVQWVWRDTRSEKTNVALSATMNFF
jgi:hypothetical protein